MRARLVWLLVTVIASACGGDSEIPTLLVNDQCQFNGPSSVETGEVRFTLQRTGLGDYGGAVVTFEGDHGPDDLRAHFEAESSAWEDRPDWVNVEYLLETLDEDLTREDHVGETTVMTLSPGEHSVICIYYADQQSDVAGTVEVRPAD